MGQWPAPGQGMLGYGQQLLQQAQQAMGGAGTAAGGMPPPSGSNWSEVEGLLLDPKRAAWNYLLDQGINPMGSQHGARLLMDRASDIVTSLLPQLGMMNADVSQVPNMLRGQFDRVMSGQPVFYKNDPGTRDAILGGLRAFEQNYNAGGPEPMGFGSNLLAQILGDSTQATNLLGTLLYGGLNAKLRNFMEGNLSQLPSMMDRLLAIQGEGDPTLPKSSLLADLLAGRLQGSALQGPLRGAARTAQNPLSGLGR